MGILHTVLKDRYCILEQIGKGGSGTVYLAKDMNLGVLRAVKEIPSDCRKEADMMLKLSHPSLPGVADYVEDGEKCYIIMEYIKGKSLGQYLKEGKIFSISDIIRIGTETADILVYLHSRKPPVYYGDLKPDNLIMNEDGRIYLVDFGSSVRGYGKGSRICTGTKGFAAPEQFKGFISESSDQYNLGKTLQALLGKRKYLLTIRKPSLFLILFRCCRKKPSLRYSNMETVEKKLIKFSRTKKGDGIRNIFILSICAGIFLMGFTFFSFRQTRPDFYTELTSVTELYHQDDFFNEKKSRQVCINAEKKLQKLLKKFQKKQEQRKLLLLLAANSEYQKEYDKAALYYEQLLLYDDSFREGYGEYGMFLIRTNQENKSIKLWDDFCKNIKKMDTSYTRNLEIWEKEMTSIEEKKKD
ncbi:MAG: serine/threonine-protein kinase [Clostridia bacterium]|nr:serine/threonine-protein kinase [Clostridia bacterium]